MINFNKVKNMNDSQSKSLQSIKYFGVLIFLLLISACNGQDEEVNGANNVDGIRYLALGDSYTIGQGIDAEGNWPNQLVDSLKSNGFEVDTSLIIARTGWTTTNLLDAMSEEDLSNFNLVSLLIGVNNQFQGKPFELYEDEFNELLEKAMDIAGQEKVFVVSIPDYGVTPFGSNNTSIIREELDAYNVYAREQCEKRSIPFINITEISRSLGSEEGALATDNLHPSQEQYTQWLNEILPVVEVLFK
jgi:acyl-CoA thioesterase-1